MNIGLRTGHSAVLLDNNSIVFGSCTHGLGTVINGLPSNFIEINEILDGSNNLDEIIVLMCEKFNFTQKKSRALLEFLKRRNHLEIKNEISNAVVKDFARYTRSVEYFSWIGGDGTLDRWSPQRKIQEAKVVVIGVGGIGSAVATNLVMSGIGSISLIDYDIVEKSNLNRQVLYREQDIGLEKVQVAKRRLLECNPNVRIASFNQRIESKKDLELLFNQLDDFDLLYKSADSPTELPFWLSELSIQREFPWIDASYAGPMISCVTFAPGLTGCYRCLREEEKERLSERGMTNFYTDSPTGINAAISPTVALTGALAAYEGIRFICRGTNPSLGKVLHQNLVDYSQSYVTPILKKCTHY